MSEPELSLREGAPVQAYSLRLASRPWAPVEVQIGASSDLHQRVLIQPDKWDSPHLVSVTAVDGASVERPNPRISALAHWLTSEDPAYDGLAAPSLLARVWDDDREAAPGGLMLRSGSAHEPEQEQELEPLELV